MINLCLYYAEQHAQNNEENEMKCEWDENIETEMKNILKNRKNKRMKLIDCIKMMSETNDKINEFFKINNDNNLTDLMYETFETILNKIDECHIENENESWNNSYASLKERIELIHGKQFIDFIYRGFQGDFTIQNNQLCKKLQILMTRIMTIVAIKWT